MKGKKERVEIKNVLASEMIHKGVYLCNNIPGLPRRCVVKDLPVSAGDARDVGSIPGSGRSPGAGSGNLLQYSCLENPMDRGAWRATVHGAGHIELDMPE